MACLWVLGEIDNVSTEINVGPRLLHGVGCTNGVLAETRSGRVRWPLVHPTRPTARMLCEDNNAYVWQADHLFVHRRLGAILHRQRTEAWSNIDIHEGWSGGVRGAGGLNGGTGRCSPHASTPGAQIRLPVSMNARWRRQILRGSRTVLVGFSRPNIVPRRYRT